MVERASKHYGSVHTFRRSTSPMRLVGVVGEFPSMVYEEKFFAQTCVLPCEPRLAALRWVKASHRLEWEDRGLGAERKSVQDEREDPTPNSDTCESEPEHNRLFEPPREVLLRRAG